MQHELLSPAGSIEAGYAALHYGADAVYLGLTKFSARAGAENFTADELNEFTAYAHSKGKKVFVALNTILTEDEVKELPETFAIIRRCKVDALIIQDLGVLYLAKKLIPEVELHASTQMAVHNVEGAKYLQSLGFKRVVLARELTLKEIENIAKTLPDLDLEVFVHGALCYSYSGQCLFSALEYGKSANRGRCIYPCRSIFQNDVYTSLKSSHLFSMKDLALEEKVLKIPALSLKIEGRKKSPLYVSAVTNYYRHILDGKKKDISEAEDIKQIFSRPWCQFHFNGKDKEIVDANFVGHRGLIIGKVEKVNKKRLTFKTSHKIARYDGIQIDVRGDEKPFGFSIKSLYVKNKPVFEVENSSVVEVELPEERPHLEIGSPIYLASSTEVKGKYSYIKPKPKEYQNLIPLDVNIEISKNKIWAMSDETVVYIEGDFEKAKDATKVIETIQKSFNKTGGTNFYINSLKIINNNELFVPVSVLNELRRKLLDTVTIKEISIVLPAIKPYKNTSKEEEFSVYRIEINTNVENLNKEQISNTYFILPQICRNTTKLKQVIEKLYNLGARLFVAENYYAFEIMKPYKDITLASGGFLYVMNSYATAQLKEMNIKWCIPALESSPENMEEIANNSSLPIVQVTKGNPPLFTSAVCIRENACKDCNQKEKIYHLKKDGKEYTAISKNCQIQLFNKKPYSRDKIKANIYGIIKNY